MAASIQVYFDGKPDAESKRWPLAADTLLGSNPRSCTWVIQSREVHAEWIKIRWNAKHRRWFWFNLKAQLRDTTGPAASLPGVPDGWMLLSGGTRRIRGPGVRLQLVEDGPPQNLIIDRKRNTAVEDEDECERILRDWPQIDRILEPEHVVGGVLYHYYPCQPTHTYFSKAPAFDLEALDTTLVLRPKKTGWSLWVELEQNRKQEAESLKSKCLETTKVLSLLPYVYARISEPEGGWLDRNEATQRYNQLRRELGYEPVQQPEQIREDHSRIEQDLAMRHVRVKDEAGASLLFQHHTVHRLGKNLTLCRIALPPERIRIRDA